MIGDFLEIYTFEYLINKALQNVPDTVDKREGSIIYDALAPACYELADYYMELRKTLDNVFVSTANGEYLDLKVAEQGLTRYPATQSIRKGVFTTESGPAVIPIGSRFSTIDGENSVNFTVTEPYINNGVVEAGSYRLTCEEYGAVGNNYIGDLLTLTNINGLTSAQLTSVSDNATAIIPGRDAETDEELRTRYLQTVNQKPFGGNVAQYDEQIKNIGGVGEVQVHPVWNGGGTVNCSVISATDYLPISKDFISQIQNEIDPTPQGNGLGMAPIGHTVTITTPKTKTINIEATVATTTYSLQHLYSAIKEQISEYILQLRRNWGVANNNVNNESDRYSLKVYLSRINYAIVSVNYVENAASIKINGNESDLELTLQSDIPNLEYGIELPILGTVTLRDGNGNEYTE